MKNVPCFASPRQYSISTINRSTTKSGKNCIELGAGEDDNLT